MLDQLPDFEGLNIASLARCFNNVTNSYKFYWFLSILDHINESKDPFITYDELSLRMLALAWYPLDYYKLSFGKQDSFKNLSNKISAYFKVDNSVNSAPLLQQISENVPDDENRKLRKEITIVLKRWVSFRFLSSFYDNQITGLKDYELNKKIREMTNEADLHSDSVPYSINQKGITLNQNWIEYFKQHQYILRGFINWNLIRFLQKNNPNVIGLPEKIEKPNKRNLLFAKEFWLKYFKNHPVNCIYSNLPITLVDLSLDHFIPWSYVAHDQIWNIIPTLKTVNSSKSDSLPSIDYIERFCLLQFDAMKFHVTNSNAKFVEDYYSLLNVEDLTILSYDFFKSKMTLEIKNSIRIAEKMGFKSSYTFQSISRN
jgi:HNH endonuclease